MADQRLMNILMLSLGFMLVFVSFQTMSNILITIIASIKHEKPDYTGDAFYALAIVYGVMALFNFLVPPIISILGSRIALVLGSLGYALYIVSFFQASSLALYIASVVLGIGAATIWTAQGTYLALNSDADTIGRNSAVFWAAFQLSTLIGNAIVQIVFSGQDFFPDDSRVFIYTVLSVICALGVFVLILLRAPINVHGQQISDTGRGGVGSPLRAFTRAFSLIFTRDMLLLCLPFWFTGAHLAFSASVYSACIGFTVKLTRYPKSLIGFSGILFGLGEVVGGALFGVLAYRTTFSWGRNPVVIVGSGVILVAYVLIYLNLPTDAQFHETISVSVFDPPRAWLALLCSFLLGLGDSCFNTQIYSIVATIYRDDSAPPFAIFKFVQSIASGVAFLYFKYIALHYLLIALAVMNILATITFVPVELEARTPFFEPDELNIQIPAGRPAHTPVVTAPPPPKSD